MIIATKKNRPIFSQSVVTITVFLFLLYLSISSSQAARIKDIASIKGVRDNPLIGYGLVIGLNGTGDKTGTLFTVQSLSSMLSKMGITVNPASVKVKNVAAVMVTAKLPPFMRTGSRLDVSVSSLGDAGSLQGGTLLLTPLKGPDQTVYAVAQGAISIGGFVGGAEGDATQKNHPTAGRIPGGAIIEKEVPFNFQDHETFKIVLRHQDFTTALRLSKKINQALQTEDPAISLSNPAARPLDAGTVELRVTGPYQGREVALLAMVEGLDVTVDFPAKVVVNERTGTIVMGDQVRVSDVAIAHGNLTIRVRTEFNVSQPPPFAPESAATVVVPDRDTVVNEENSKIVLMKGGTTIGDLIRGLNAIGVSPRDLISILQSIKASGALHAALEIL